MKKTDVYLYVVTAVAVVLAIAVWKARTPPVPDYAPGDQLTNALRVPGSELATVVMHISTHCEPCAETMPFYRELAVQIERGRVNLVVSGPQSEDEIRSYIQPFGLAATRVVSLPAGSDKVSKTPTLIMASGAGVVASVYVGKMRNDADKSHVLKQLAQLEVNQ